MSDAAAKLINEMRAFTGCDLPRLVLMTDDKRLAYPLAAATRLPRGSLVVVRARERHHRAELARSMLRVARARGLRVVVADDALLAARLEADGAHFPEVHAGMIAHWRAKRPSWLITASAHSLGAVGRAASFGADAVFLSPIFATRSHPDRATLGPMRLRAIARLVSIPVYALGGVDAHSVRRLRGAEIAGVAAVGTLAGRSERR